MSRGLGDVYKRQIRVTEARADADAVRDRRLWVVRDGGLRDTLDTSS